MASSSGSWRWFASSGPPHSRSVAGRFAPRVGELVVRLLGTQPIGRKRLQAVGLSGGAASPPRWLWQRQLALSQRLPGRPRREVVGWQGDVVPLAHVVAAKAARR